MKKAAEKLLDKVVTERLKNTIIETNPENEANSAQSEILFDLKNYSEISSEINMDYMSDEGHQITQLLIDKYGPMLEENRMAPKVFSSLSLSEQFEVIEDFQRRRRDNKHEMLHEQNARNDLLAFSQTQITNFVKNAAEKCDTMKVIVEKAAKRNPDARRAGMMGNSNVKLKTKNELASQFLPESVKN